MRNVVFGPNQTTLSLILIFSLLFTKGACHCLHVRWNVVFPWRQYSFMCIPLVQVRCEQSLFVKDFLLVFIVSWLNVGWEGKGGYTWQCHRPQVLLQDDYTLNHVRYTQYSPTLMGEGRLQCRLEPFTQTVIHEQSPQKKTKEVSESQNKEKLSLLPLWNISLFSFYLIYFCSTYSLVRFCC